MAKESIGGGPRHPMDPGTTVGQIKTPMCSENVGKKNDPKTHSYRGTYNENSAGGKGIPTSNEIKGPGVKGEYPIKK